MKNDAPVGGNAIDTFDPGVVAERIGFYKALFRMFAVATDGIIPCIVREYDEESGTVSAQPIVNNVMPTLDGDKQVERPVYEDVPVFCMCHGGFEVSVPLFVGDTGLLVALDRNCDTAISANSSQLEKDQTGDGDENEGPKPTDDMTTASFDHSVFIPFSFSTGNAEKGKLKVRALGKNAPEVVITKDAATISIGESTVSATKDEIKASKGEDSITLSDSGLKYTGKIDEEFDEIADIRYDVASHQLQKKTRHKKRRGDFIVGVGKEGGWVMCEGGQAEPISTE